jgi:hypothetical protein
LDYDTLWSPVARSSYFYRQGDYADTYSEGKFRRLISGRLGIDLNFTFFDSDGRFADDKRDTRFLRFRAVGPARGDLHWSYQFIQFRDRTQVLTPVPFTLVRPDRRDLLWLMDFELYRPSDSLPGWMTGLRIQSGHQSLRDYYGAYRLSSRDQRWSLWSRRTLWGWLTESEFIWEKLKIESADTGRWGAKASVGRSFVLAPTWTSAISLEASDWDTDPFSLSVIGIIGAGEDRYPLLPTLRVSRERSVPTLFDRERPNAESLYSNGLVSYSESGEPALENQWENAISVIWSGGRRHHTSERSAFYHLECRAAYIEDYSRWDDTASSAIDIHYRPVTDDVRSMGFAASAAAPLPGNLMLYANYAAKYAATLDQRRLHGYYPHKASAVLSWMQPQVQWGIDLRANVAGIWWYGDRRIEPTLYTEPHIFRIDLSGTATMRSFHFNYLVQNVFNFAYRTGAGYDMTGRTVRFGIEWHFLD